MDTVQCGAAVPHCVEFSSVLECAHIWGIGKFSGMLSRKIWGELENYSSDLMNLNFFCRCWTNLNIQRMATIFVSEASQAGSKNSVHWVESRIKSLSSSLDLSVSAF